MSEIVIALILLAPVLLVVLLLNNSRKKQKKKTQEKLSAYLGVIIPGGITKSFQKQLVHQLVIIDEGSRRILLVNHHEHPLSHEQYSLDYIKTLKVANIKQTIRDEQSKKTEVITTHIGVEIGFEKPDKEILIVFYDHMKHSIFHMADMEKEAWELHEKIAKAKIGQLVNI
jgi:hypothetical protein